MVHKSVSSERLWYLDSSKWLNFQKSKKLKFYCGLSLKKKNFANDYWKMSRMWRIFIYCEILKNMFSHQIKWSEYPVVFAYFKWKAGINMFCLERHLVSWFTSITLNSTKSLNITSRNSCENLFLNVFILSFKSTKQHTHKKYIITCIRNVYVHTLREAMRVCRIDTLNESVHHS